MTLLLTFASTLLGGLCLTPLAKILGASWGFLDQPDSRKIHQQPMVRMGGLAICAATFLGLLGMMVAGVALPTSNPAFMAMLLGSVGFFAIGLADDRWSLSPILRLGLQGIITVITWYFGLRLDVLPIPGIGTIDLGLFSLPITFLWLAGVTNAINWLDGLDGLASGVSAIAAMMFALVNWKLGNSDIALVSMAVAGATIGFLRYNFKPAQLYMGDSGSYFLGSMLGGIAILTVQNHANFTLAMLPYVILAVPILDMTFVIVSRLREGKSPFFPDRRHIHHRLLQAGLSQTSAVLSIYGLMGWAGLSGILLNINYVAWSNVFLLVFILLITQITIKPQITQLPQG
ncbi:MAG: hypothetical protein B0A82_01015 [Alkalinema sp. CACIAM 70d]|nr:MAG: hypothetical protein B0A82_01015 [Alkalinema sp. CACIAM 70d]